MTVAYKSRCKRGQMIDRDIPLILLDPLVAAYLFSAF